MSLDKSLKSQNSLVRHRNVLSRAERLEKLEDEQRWNEGESVMGLAKVVHRKAALAKKEKAKVGEAAEATTEEAVETSEPTK
jgi:small basic protein (TIGR04137 family)